MFAARFSDPTPTGRPDLCFRDGLTGTRVLKDEWSFVWEDTLRSNIAATLQDVEFDIHLVNQYNVFWTPLAIKFKHAIVQAASVAEAVLDYTLRMVEDDERVRKVLGTKWTLRDFAKVPMPGVDVPEGVRIVSGTQEQIQNVLDRNTKMQLLIRAARAVEMVDDEFGKELDKLREIRNRIHIKTLTDPEYATYTPKMANDALDTLERFRAAALMWTVNHRTQNPQSMTATLDAQVAQVVAPPTPDDWPVPVASINSTPTFAVNDVVEHETLGSGVVTGVEPGGVVTVHFTNGATRRLMVAYAPMRKVGVASTDDDFAF